MVKTGLIVLFVILIIWIYTMQYSNIYLPQIFTDELLNSPMLKTGDLILFKAYNNFNSIFHGSYFGHMGIVYIDEEDPQRIPYIFEANGAERLPLLPHHSKEGIYFTPLAARMKKYKGRCFYKELSEPLPVDTIKEFRNFIFYCLDNFKYDLAIFANGFKKYFGLKRCDSATDCGQICFLSLIKMGLLPIEEYDVPRLHHLKYVCQLKELTEGRYFRDLVEIIEHPFDS